MNQNICNNCGGEYEYRGGRWICRACGAYRPTEISNEEVTLLYVAYQKLRRADFDDAEKDFDDIIQKYPENPNGYWGRLMSHYGIKYEQDFDGRMIPTCYATSIESVIASSDYKKALEYSDREAREYYRKQAEYVERVRKEWIEKASREKPYDIFISYKDSDLANGVDRTQDSIEMQELYIHLTAKGYRVFYSRESLRDKVGEKYEPYIFSALSTAKVMLVYGSKPEYITSTWLKNEWTRYEKRIAAGEKQPDSLLVACDGFSPSELPRELSSRQCFNASVKSFYSDLDETLERLLRTPKKQAAVSEPIFRDKEPIGTATEKTKKKSFVPFVFIGLFLLICGFAVYAMMGGNVGSVPNFEASTAEPGHTWVPGVNDGKDPLHSESESTSDSSSGKEPWGGDPNCEHHIVTESGQEPTCTEDGWTTKEYCSLCNMQFKERETIPAVGHQSEGGPTETQAQICTLCGEILAYRTGTPGLAYEYNDNGSWTLTGLGTATATEIYIPEYYEGLYVGAIAANAFKDQTHLTAIHVSDTVSEIGTRAFYGCTGLTELTIGREVSMIGSQAFYRCNNLKTLYCNTMHSFDENQNTFLKQTSVEKVIFDGERAPAILHGVTSVKEIVFTDNVKYINPVGACPNLTKVTIGSGVTELYGFRDCTGLEEIVIPANIKTIGGEAFYGCTALSKVTFEGDVEIIENYAFANCTALTEIVLPESVTEIRNHAFWGSGLVSITIPENVFEIGIEVFARCESLREVILPDGLMDIPYQAFLGCISLTNVTIPESVYTIGESAFKECTALRTITIPLDVAEIQTSAFEGCTGLVEVINHSTLELKTGDTEHGYVAYYALVVHDGEESQLVTFGDYTVYDQGEKYLLLSYNGTETAPVLPDMIGGKYYTIAQGAFAGRSDITSITVPATVTEIGEGAFAGCTGLVSMDLPFVGGSADGTEKFGYIFGTQKYGDNDIYAGGYYIPEALTSVTVRGGLIGEYAIEYCSNLKEIILDDAVTSIGAYAFRECNALVSLTTPIACPITEGYDFFYNFFNDNADSVPAGLKVTFTGDTLPERAFAECSKIEEIVLTGNLTGIANDAFRNCSALKKIVIPASVTFIGMNAFERCGSLTTINFAGTQAQWNAILFGSDWDSGMGEYAVICADGVITEPTEPDTPTEPEPPEAPSIPSDVKVGQTITFGSYEQDNNSENGREAIEWIVFGVQDGKALVMSRYGLDAQSYHAYNANVTWEKSSLRQWLNEDFLKSAFTAEEQALIAQTTVSAEANPVYTTNQGSDTQDWIFLLSIGEVQTYVDFLMSCEPTDYAQANGVMMGTSSQYQDRCAWWLRTSGNDNQSVAYVSAAGVIFEEGDPVLGKKAVRPAMWVELNP